MGKVFKKNIYLTVKEYLKIKEFLENKQGKVNIIKNVTIKDGDDIFKFKIIIKSKLIEVLINVILEENPILKDSFINTYGHNINSLMGVMECKYDTTISKDINYYFYFNIDVVYDKEHFSIKYNYYKYKQDRLKESLVDNLGKKVLNEIIYAEFNREEDIALVTYCLFTQPYMLLSAYNYKTIELYEEKLFYVGIDLEDYYDKWEDYEMYKVEALVRKASRKDIFELMLSYVAFLKNNKKKYWHGGEISKIGYLLYDAYIKLL